MLRFVGLLLAFVFLSGCNESSNSEIEKETITIKNRLQEYAQNSVNIVVTVKAGDKLYANSKLVKSFDKSEDANVSIILEGKDGLKVITLEKEDSSGNFAQPITLKVIKDTTPPSLELLGDKKIDLLEGAQFKEPGFKVEDNIDKEVKVVKSSDLNSSRVGKYIINYTATDKAGNSVTKQREVIVLDQKSYNFAPVVNSSVKSSLDLNDSDRFELNLNSIFSDKNGDTLRYSVSGLPSYLTLKDNGVIVGSLPKDASKNGPVTIEIKASDSGGKSVTKEFTLNIKNSKPIAKNDSVKVYMNKTLTIDILANDSDSDGDSLTIKSISKPSHGEATIKDGKVLYKPNSDFVGSDSFSYTISDSDGASSRGVVDIEVKKFKDIPVIYLSQDTWDRDNYSLIAAAKKMHQRELIDLRSVDITGKDADNKVSNVFRAILGDGIDIPVLINHSFYGRLTPTTSRFPQLAKFVDSVILDSEVTDSTEFILADLESIDTKQEVVYVVGGHLHNFASLLLADEELVNQKVDKIVISTGWEDRVHGKPEVNLSEGVYKETSTSKATQIVFSKFKGRIVMASDPDARYPVLDTSRMDRSSALWYFISHGKYNDQQLHIGDFEALLYGAVKENWYGNHWVDTKAARCSVTRYGAVKVTKNGRECYYLDNMNSYYTKAVLEELLYRED